MGKRRKPRGHVGGRRWCGAKVTLNLVVGLSNPKAMKLIGLIGGRKVVVMIDPGATPNFISLETTDEQQIPVKESGGYGVYLGTGLRGIFG